MMPNALPSPWEAHVQMMCVGARDYHRCQIAATQSLHEPIRLIRHMEDEKSVAANRVRIALWRR